MTPVIPAAAGIAPLTGATAAAALGTAGAAALGSAAAAAAAAFWAAPPPAPLRIKNLSIRELREKGSVLNTEHSLCSPFAAHFYRLLEAFRLCSTVAADSLGGRSLPSPISHHPNLGFAECQSAKVVDEVLARSQEDTIDYVRNARRARARMVSLLVWCHLVGLLPVLPDQGVKIG
jgi:hypothetical protein